MILDFHTRAFPDVLAPRAMGVLIKNAGNLEPFTDGTAGGLRGYLARSRADMAVALNIATNPRQQRSVNDFAISINAPPLIAFGSVHPDAPDTIEELYRLREAGIKGIKLHPDYQDFFADDDRLLPLYEKIGELGFITVFHSGVDIEYFEPVHCTPERLRRALPAFGGATVVAAHMGGYMRWYDVEEYLVGEDVYFDTSFSYGRMPREHAKRIIKNHGAGRILLGSDMPWSGTDNEIKFLNSLDLSVDEINMILGGNAEKLLGIRP